MSSAVSVLLVVISLTTACSAGTIATVIHDGQQIVNRVLQSYQRLASHNRALSRRSLLAEPHLLDDDIARLYQSQIYKASGEEEERLKKEQAMAEAFKPHHVPACHPDCHKRGTCDRQWGRCLCPFGFTGPTCEEMLLPACRLLNQTVQEADAAGLPLLLTCASNSHRNCECFRQCWEHYCRKGVRQDVCQLWRERNEKCYTYVGLPPEEQLSVMPPADADNDTVHYYKGILPDQTGMEAINRTVFELDERTQGTVLHLSRCLNNCSFRGVCSSFPFSGAMCSCYSGFRGQDCSQPIPSFWCPHNCNGRGTCDRGFCHCKPPYFGMDCSKNQTYPARVAPPFSGRLKVYVYDLPSHIAFQDGYFPGWAGHMDHYLGWWIFLQRLLKDNAVLTHDPYEANLFYVPALTYYYSGNTGEAGEHIRVVTQYLKQAYPFWDRYEGRDHAVFIANDRGSCFFDDKEPDFDRIITITHFGLHRSPGGEVGKTTMILPRAAGCFDPQKDVVAPGNKDMLGHMAATTYRSEKGKERFEQERTVTLVFAGSIRSDDLVYSGGVRQEAYHLFNRGSEEANASMVVHSGYHPAIEELVHKAKFCLAPYGWGWGIRISEMIMQGCVPVIIQDHVYQPFEDLLPYDDFTLRLPKQDLRRAQEVLEAVSEQEWRRLHDNLKLYWQAFVWEKDAGGQVYEYIIASLRRRLRYQLAGHYRKMMKRRVA